MNEAEDEDDLNGPIKDRDPANWLAKALALRDAATGDRDHALWATIRNFACVVDPKDMDQFLEFLRPEDHPVTQQCALQGIQAILRRHELPQNCGRLKARIVEVAEQAIKAGLGPDGKTEDARMDAAKRRALADNAYAATVLADGGVARLTAIFVSEAKPYMLSLVRQKLAEALAERKSVGIAHSPAITVAIEALDDELARRPWPPRKAPEAELRVRVPADAGAEAIKRAEDDLRAALAEKGLELGAGTEVARPERAAVALGADSVIPLEAGKAKGPLDVAAQAAETARRRFPSVREVMDAARAAGHDSFGIASDPEAIDALERIAAKKAEDARAEGRPVPPEALGVLAYAAQRTASAELMGNACVHAVGVDADAVVVVVEDDEARAIVPKEYGGVPVKVVVQPGGYGPAAGPAESPDELAEKEMEAFGSAVEKAGFRSSAETLEEDLDEGDPTAPKGVARIKAGSTRFVCSSDAREGSARSVWAIRDPSGVAWVVGTWGGRAYSVRGSRVLGLVLDALRLAAVPAILPEDILLKYGAFELRSPRPPLSEIRSDDEFAEYYLDERDGLALRRLRGEPLSEAELASLASMDAWIEEHAPRRQALPEDVRRIIADVLARGEARRRESQAAVAELVAAANSPVKRPGRGPDAAAEPSDEKPAPIVAPPKVGRNEPCPCGSGRKHKKCCLREGQ